MLALKSQMPRTLKFESIFSRSLFSVLVFAAIFSSPSAARAQQSSTVVLDEPKQTPATIRAMPRLLHISVLAEGKNGEPIESLTRENFELTDDSKPQTIAGFSVVRAKDPASCGAPSSPGAFSNRWGDTGGCAAGATVVLIDALNTKFHDLPHVSEKLSAFLMQVQPHEHVGIYGLGNGLTVLSKLTDDSSAILDQLKKSAEAAKSKKRASKSESGSESAQERTDPLVEFLSLNATLLDFYRSDPAWTTASALAAIASQLAAIPGRKNLIWLTARIPFRAAPVTFSGSPGELAIRALTDADVSVYPIYLPAIMPDFAESTVSSGFIGSFQGGIIIGGSPTSLLSFLTLADDTGGQFSSDPHEVNKSILRRLDESRVTYDLAYLWDPAERDGKFHGFKIKLRGASGRLRYVAGRYAATGGPPNSTDEENAYLFMAASVPFDGSAIPITMETKAIDVPGAQKLKATFHVEFESLQLSQTRERVLGKLEIYCAQLSPHGKFVTGAFHPFNLDMTRQKFEENLKEGLRFEWDLAVDSRATAVRFIVRDTLSGATGSVTIPLLELFPSLRKDD